MGLDTHTPRSGVARRQPADHPRRRWHVDERAAQVNVTGRAARVHPHYGFYALPTYVVVCGAPALLGALLWWLGPEGWARCVGAGLVVYAGLQALGCWLGVYVLPEERVARARRVARSLAGSQTRCFVDIGAGRGLLAIEFAGALDPTIAVAVDIWRKNARSDAIAYDRSAPVFAHSAAHTRRNAQIEGVSERLRLVTSDATCLGLRSASADIVTAGYLLFHLHEGGLRRSDERRLMALREWARILRPGGRLVVFELTHTGWTNVLAWTPIAYAASRWLSAPLSPEYWTGLIEEAGMRVESCEERRGNVVLVARRDGHS
jgi:ubiquinone/menaquinone biosynthesis C-methylase UbiE